MIGAESRDPERVSPAMVTQGVLTVGFPPRVVGEGDDEGLESHGPVKAREFKILV
jgi:hypothetical protein